MNNEELLELAFDSWAVWRLLRHDKCVDWADWQTGRTSRGPCRRRCDLWELQSVSIFLGLSFQGSANSTAYPVMYEVVHAF